MPPTDARRTKFIRLPDFDYRTDGAYFVTIVTTHWGLLFGSICDGAMTPNLIGDIVIRHWDTIPAKRPGVVTDAFVLMPNHVHGIVCITPEVAQTTQASSLHRPSEIGERPRGPGGGSLAAIIGAFKSGVAREVNTLRRPPGARLWQANYYERVIRNEDELLRVREYIVANPLCWEADDDNPLRSATPQPDPW